MKNIYIIFLSLLFVAAQAQEQTSGEAAPVSKSGVPILPSAGDIAIGADALPYLNYLGNMFNNTVGNTLALGSQNLYIRYHVTDNSAIRAIFRIEKKETYRSWYVQDDAARFADPLSRADVEDKQTTSINGYGINLAYQMNRGYGKLRGFYGAQLSYDYVRTIVTNAYGNNITEANPNPSTVIAQGIIPVGTRYLELDGGYTQSAGIGVLLGVEYYFAPKICIGGEIGIGYKYEWNSQRNSKTEGLVGSKVEQFDTAISPGDKSHELGTIRPANYGGLYLLFHF